MEESEKAALNRKTCEALDAQDPLRHHRARFCLPEGTIYLDGNSLGALPTRTAAKIDELVRVEWGNCLIGSWNTHSWVTLPQRVGAKLSRLIGVNEHDVIVADSTSVNIFKLLAGALALPDVKDRRVILSERGNFPTDLYIAEGVNAMLDGRYTVKLVDAEEIDDAFDADVAVALITQVDYRSGRLHNMAKLNASARRAGTRIVWDLSHSAGAIPVELLKDGSEFAVGCGYKYLNGGPGAPAFLYVSPKLQTDLATPLSGWFGHQTPFSFEPTYTPAKGIERLQCGTPSVIALTALECGIDTFEGTTLDAIRKKSIALSELFRVVVNQECADMGLTCVSPTDPERRGSQLSFAHDNAYAIMQALIDRGVVGDFRRPNLLRFGFTPLYVRFVDCWDAVHTLRDILLSGGWKADKYQTLNTVT